MDQETFDREMEKVRDIGVSLFDNRKTNPSDFSLSTPEAASELIGIINFAILKGKIDPSTAKALVSNVSVQIAAMRVSKGLSAAAAKEASKAAAKEKKEKPNLVVLPDLEEHDKTLLG